MLTENVYPFLQYSDVVIKADELPATIWCRWQSVGNELPGCVLIKVAEEVVLREKIAYLPKLPE
jgi:hypothetical protein